MFNRYLTVTERRHLLATVRAVKGPEAARDAASFDVLQLTGMRLGEFVSLTVGDAALALQTGLLVIKSGRRKGGNRRKGPQHGGSPDNFKATKKRSVPDFERHVTAALREALLALLQARAVLFGICEDPDAPLLMSRFGAQHGKAMSPRSIQMRTKYWVTKAGLDPRASPHWMRHSRAKDLLRSTTSKDPMGIVQSALGHTSRSSTAIYTAPDKEDLMQAAMDADRLAVGAMSRRAARRFHVESERAGVAA